jgi:glycosyltransferase involved in cell wall biosynthesis
VIKPYDDPDMSFTQIETVDHALTTSLAVSIVIPVHNGGESFRRCLASLKLSIPASTEVIIVVDGGTDNSYQLAEAFGAKVIQLLIAGRTSTGTKLRCRDSNRQHSILC